MREISALPGHTYVYPNVLKIDDYGDKSTDYGDKVIVVHRCNRSFQPEADLPMA